MWTPADINAHPTKEDYINAKLAIIERETELADALLALAQAQIRVANLENDIRERQAWIAPIRKLGFDVLSLIFERCSEGEWHAPLRIGAVSRTWRAVVLHSPRAWSIIDLRYLKDANAVNTYLHRSRTCLIHARIPQRGLGTVLQISNRVSCASVSFHQALLGLTFPNLRRLKVGNNPLPQFFERGRFPALRHLICSDSLYDPDLFAASSSFEGFPPLNTLEINTMRGRTFNDMLKACSASLVTLTVSYAHLPQDKCIINLPNLICLCIHRASARTHSWPVVLVTPALRSYVEMDTTYPDEGPIHKALGTVTHLRLSRMPPLSECGQLTRLQIANRDELVYPALIELAANKTICPDLEAIEVHLPHGAPVDADAVVIKTLEITTSRERPFQITFHPRLRDDFPGFPVKLCDSGMPCS
ncbi:hypothetical protein M408DRAFT_30333 [Serendipita vermifera MAFF 305830]|uniref:F-box domain-containing protein n=1 Tax=Serendipita vermifera MAFF 305830 TaxID=933852 RepID=A0A0C2WSE0_SERVB|nr:hypothetical protein M408DRAFT_30333 [Serendipita vermifera MAFF 305830]